VGSNRTQSQSLNSVNVSDGFNFSINNSLNLKSATRWFKNRNSSSLSYNFGYTNSSNKTTETKNYSNSLAWGTSWNDRMRTSFSINRSSNESVNLLSVSEGSNMSANWSLTYLLSNPFKISTFTGNFLRFKNRLSLTHGINWSTGESSRDGDKKSDSMNWGTNLGVSYDLQENFRVTGGATYSVNTNDITPDNDNTVTSLNASAELRF